MHQKLKEKLDALELWRHFVGAVDLHILPLGLLPSKSPGVGAYEQAGSCSSTPPSLTIYTETLCEPYFIVSQQQIEANLDVKVTPISSLQCNLCFDHMI